jgi:hypothetical protein
MDKNKFWLGGRLFNTASPRLGAPTQCKARPEDGRPNAAQGTSASWAPQRNARHVRKLGAPTHVHNANTRHVRKLGAPTQCKACPQDGRPNAKCSHIDEKSANRLATVLGRRYKFLPHLGFIFFPFHFTDLQVHKPASADLINSRFIKNWGEIDPEFSSRTF